MRAVICVAALLVAHAPPAPAQSTEVELQKYRRMVAEDNPGEIWELKGEEAYQRKRGPDHASLERCDFGLGPGRLEGAFARLPRFFADAGRVMDLEARLVWCMETLQGLKRADVLRTRFGNADRDSDLEALTTFIAAKSNGRRIEVSLEHPKVREAYRVGEALFYRRMSLMDFACASCHADQGKRIRLQDLYNATNKKEIDSVMSGWPAYRVSASTVRTMQHRLFDCGWQMRLPNVEYGSEWTVALHTFLSYSANGAQLKTPGMRR